MGKEKVLNLKYNKTPKVMVRTIAENDTSLTKASKTKYPFELMQAITITVTTDKRAFAFDIYKNFVWNGADIPRMVWTIIGTPTENDYLIPSMIHDYILEFKNYILHDKLHYELTLNEYLDLTSQIFCKALILQGVSEKKAKLMSWFVNMYQLHFNPDKKKGN